MTGKEDRMDIRKTAARLVYKYTEFDRVAERKVKRAVAIWHKGGSINHLRARLMWNRIRRKYSCDCYPGITVGDGLRIEHPIGILIGKTAILGNNVRIYNDVQIIAKVTGDDMRKENKERRHARIGNNVLLGSGCTVIGPITIGDDCIIGARAIVTRDIPGNSVVIGTNQIRARREDDTVPGYKTF